MRKGAPGEEVLSLLREGLFFVPLELDKAFGRSILQKMNFLMVGLGGALGASARYGISLIPVKAKFPVLTLLTNFLGAFLIGIIAGLAEVKNVSEARVLFWKTGVCGGFTTFSTFSLETLNLLEEGQAALGIIYMALSMGMCLLGVLVGRNLVRGLY